MLTLDGKVNYHRSELNPSTRLDASVSLNVTQHQRPCFPSVSRGGVSKTNKKKYKFNHFNHSQQRELYYIASTAEWQWLVVECTYIKSYKKTKGTPLPWSYFPDHATLS